MPTWPRPGKCDRDHGLYPGRERDPRAFLRVATDFSDIRVEVAEANRELANAGLVSLSFGNASQADRENGVFAIKPSGQACDSITPDQVVVVALETGKVVWGNLRPSSDSSTHRVLYQHLLAIGGIVHTHSIHATSWAQAGLPIPCLGTTHADHFRGEVPLTRQMSAAEINGDYEANTGLVIAELFGSDGPDPESTPGVLVASHGPFAWGKDARAGVDNAAVLEFVARLASQTLGINPSSPSIGEALLERHFSRKHGPTAYYGQR
jgi:L-ribulose-5-phosphate 4-epimerase